MGAKTQAVDAVVPRTSWGDWLRRLFIWLFALLAALTFATYVAVRWVERQVLNTDNWVALVSPLPQQKVVADALGSAISQKVINEDDIKARIIEALPPKADFLAGPLAGQVATLTTRATQKLVASDGFKTIWEGANRLAMNRLLAKSRGQQTPLQARINEQFKIDISQVGGQLKGGLGKLGDAIPALQPASKQAIAISADLQTKPRRIHQVIRTIDTIHAILPWTAAASFLIALAVSWRRRLTAMATATTAIVLLLVELIAVSWLRGSTLDKVRHPENLQAVSYIFDTLAAGLRNILIWAIVLMLVVIVLCGLVGPSKWAEKFRSLTSLNKLHFDKAREWWRKTRAWAMRWKYYTWLAIGLLVLAGLALADQVSGQKIVNAIMLALSLGAIIHILATPREHLA